MSTDRIELISKMKNLGVVYSGNVNLKNAGKSNFYLDVKKCYGYPEILNSLTKNLYDLLNSDINCIAGSGRGGIPLGTALSLKYNYNFSTVREEKKNRG